MSGEEQGTPLGLEETRLPDRTGPKRDATISDPPTTAGREAGDPLEETVAGDAVDPAASLERTVAGAADSLPPAARSAARSRAGLDHPTDPDRIGRHVVVRRLGAGGMGVVYAAYDPELDRKIAVKLIRDDPSGGTDASQGRARLLREAQAMAKLSHPNVIQVYDVGTHDGQVYIAMEFVDGQTLGDWARREARPWREIVTTYLAAGRGLAGAHAAGLIHRDFKPDNVLVGKDGRVRVLDFGLARSGPESSNGDATEPGASSAGRPCAAEGSLDVALTTTGAVMGTPAYMSPEQFAGDSTDPATDQFSFCVALLEALEGRRPFEGETMASLSFNVLEGKVREPPAGGKTPAWLRRVLVRGLARDPRDRWPSMDALLDALEQDPARRTRRVAGGLALVAGLSGLLYAAARPAEALERCDASAAWDGVWDERRRGELRERFAASSHSFADRSFSSVAGRFDELVGSWQRAYRDSCQTRLDSGPSAGLAQQEACLEARKQEIEAALELLLTADVGTLRRANEVAMHLDDPASCLDPAYLAIQVPPPEDPAARAAALELRQALARVRTLEDAGRYEEASALADDLVARARELDFPPLTAEALARAGRVQVLRGDQRAVSSLEEAFQLGYAHAHDHAAFEAATELVLAVGRDRGDPAGGEAWADLAAAALERTGARDEDRARLDLSRARVAVLAADFDGATRLARAALDAAVKIHGADAPATARYLLGLAEVLEETGDYHESQTRYEEALAIRERHLGSDHPELSTSLAGLGSLHLRRGELDEALELYERALAIEESAGGDSRGLQDALNGVGNVYTYRGDPARALGYYERALASCERLFGPEHPEIAKYASNLGQQYFELGELAKADEYSRRAVALDEHKLGPDHPALAYPLNNLAQVEFARGNGEAALAYMSRAVDVETRGLGPDHPNLSGRLYQRGVLLTELERYDEARRDVDRALEIDVLNLEPTDPQIGWDHFYIGELEQRRGNRDEAPLHYQRALAIFTAEPGDADGVGWANLSLADLRHEAGDASAALVHLEAALDAFESSDEVDAEGLATTARFLASALRRSDPERARELLARAEELAPSEPATR